MKVMFTTYNNLQKMLLMTNYSHYRIIYLFYLVSFFTIYLHLKRTILPSRSKKQWNNRLITAKYKRLKNTQAGIRCHDVHSQNTTKTYLDDYIEYKKTFLTNQTILDKYICRRAKRHIIWASSKDIYSPSQRL